MRRTARTHANPLRPASAASVPASSAKNHGEPPWAEKPTANRGKKRASSFRGQSAGSAGTTPPLFLDGAAKAYDGASEIRQAWTRGRKRRAARQHRIWVLIGCFKNSHSATVCNSASENLPQPGACKRPGNTLRAFLVHLAHHASSCAFPSAGHPRTRLIITHCGAVQKRERIQIPDCSRFPIGRRARTAWYTIYHGFTTFSTGTSQPSHASGRTRVKSSQSVALLSSSVKTYARTSVKPVSPIKCPYTACPSRIAAKETPYPGRVISWPFPAKTRKPSRPHISPSFAPSRRGAGRLKLPASCQPRSKHFI